MQKHHEGHGWWVLDRGFLCWCGYLSVPDRYVECFGIDTAEMEKQIHKYEFMLRIECGPGGPGHLVDSFSAFWHFKWREKEGA